ncbi:MULTISPECIES: TadE/TadG family type IV pilus assembly protein [Jiangella]|uniref:TadE-like protein n=1 Tax=Jiangella alba TaxID=561176 RepID=A0A1H5PXB0_9ACTN|nr:MULTISPECIES: TadE family protein [Jiangella]SDT48208.1 TadE-like protein [Jiangella sp. DSM 45060]SEF18329.1 TadE-like protein [Jiangella alba]
MNVVQARLARLRSRPERGASAIELALYTPIMFLIIFIIVQFSLTWHGNQIAAAAAREAARTARIGGGTPEALAAAEARGREYADAVGNGHLVITEINAIQVGENVRVTVRGRSTEIINNLAPEVTQTIEGPIEQFVPDL